MHTRLGLSFVLGVLALVTGCASTQVETTGATPAPSLCQRSGEALSALVLWGPAWRSDQKDVVQREDAARSGIDAFLATSGCFARYHLRRLAGGSTAVVPDHRDLPALAASTTPASDRVVVITVRELGPVVKLLGSAALVEGGTEVVLDIAAVDAATGARLADLRTHWRNGGAMVVKGTATLPQDMSAALYAALRPGVVPTRQ